MANSFSLGLLILLMGVWPVWGQTTTTAPATQPQRPTAKEILARLQPGHPRLILTAARLAELKQQCETDAWLKESLNTNRQHADFLLKQLPRKYEIPDGLRLLATSRDVLDRVQKLALVYRLTGHKDYLDRLWKELDAVAQFPDWNPKHFLDTAEMTAALAIGYDWCFDSWTPAQRETLVTAIRKFGFTPGLERIKRQEWWTVSKYNWNQVCFGGLMAGAIALADVAPDDAGAILEAGIANLPLALATYAPDGGWAEGPGYWDYATRYTIYALAGLQTGLGTDYGLSDIPGLDHAGQFPLVVSGPTGKTFNFSDAKSGMIVSPNFWWLAQRYQQPLWAQHQHLNSKRAILDMIWYDPALLNAKAPALSLDHYVRTVEVFTARSQADDPKALWVAFKAGSNQVGHAQLDIGTFVLESGGFRFIEDLGSDDYNLPGYFGKARWDYYRLRAEGHNTLAFNLGKTPDQDSKADTTIQQFITRPQWASAVADLTPAYLPHITKVQRGVAMVQRQAVLVQDEITIDKPANFYSFFHTRAKVEIHDAGKRAVLTAPSGAGLEIVLAEGAGKLEVLPAGPLPESPQPEKQDANEGVKKVALRQTLPAGKHRYAIWLLPAGSKIPELKLTALADWK